MVLFRTLSLNTGLNTLHRMIQDNRQWMRLQTTTVRKLYRLFQVLRDDLNWGGVMNIE